MSSREQAFQLADAEIARIKQHDHPDTQVIMTYALILVLADISERLDDIDSTLEKIWTDSIGGG